MSPSLSVSTLQVRPTVQIHAHVHVILNWLKVPLWALIVVSLSVLALKQADDLSRVYPASAGIDSSPLNWMKKMDGHYQL